MIAVLIVAILKGFLAIIGGCLLGDLLYRGLRRMRAYFVPPRRLVDDEG